MLGEHCGWMRRYAVLAKPKLKTRADKIADQDQKEVDVFLSGLESREQVQEPGKPLKPGVTHVRKTAPKGEVKIIRKRFSAI
jgi:hypothetical protein